MDSLDGMGASLLRIIHHSLDTKDSTFPSHALEVWAWGILSLPFLFPLLSFLLRNSF